MSKPAKPAETGDTPPKSKKMLIIIIAVVVLLAGGGGAAYFLMKKPAHPPKQEQSAEAGDVNAEDSAAEEDGAGDGHGKAAPKYVDLGTFTGKLVDSSADRYLQISISAKLSKPELEEKIKERNPEIMHKINMLLQSKRPAELETVEGKEKLANDIKAQVEYVLGLRHSAPEIRSAPLPDATDENSATDEKAHASHDAPESKESRSKRGVDEILFTSLLIQ